MLIAFPHRGARKIVRPSGATISMLNLAGGLKRRGLDAVLLVHTDARSELDGWSGEFRPTEGPWRDVAESYGLTCYTVDSPYIGKGAPTDKEHVAVVRSFAKSWRNAIDQLGIGCIHTNDAATHWTWGELTAQIGIPQIWHERGLFSQGNRAGAHLAKARAVITISDFVRSLAPAGVQERAHVVANPIEIPVGIDRAKERSNFLGEFSLPEDAVLFGMAANANSRKRWDLFVRAAQEVVKARPERPAYFVAIGDGCSAVSDMMGTLPKEVADRLILAGYRSPIHGTLKALDCVLACADDEPLGRVVVEAGLLDTPILANSSGGHIELLREWSPQSLVDAQDIPQRCVAFLDNPGAFDKAVVLLRNYFHETFARDAHVRNIVDIYGRHGLLS